MEGKTMALWMALISLGLLIIGFAGGYAVDHPTLRFMLHHLGGLGAVSLLASGAAAIAVKRGYGYRGAYLAAFTPAVAVGIVAAYLVPPGPGAGRPAACGGSVSLGIGLIVLIYWAIFKRRIVSGVP
jgi:hypothetical protein